MTYQRLRKHSIINYLGDRLSHTSRLLACINVRITYLGNLLSHTSRFLSCMTGDFYRRNTLSDFSFLRRTWISLVLAMSGIHYWCHAIILPLCNLGPAESRPARRHLSPPHPFLTGGVTGLSRRTWHQWQADSIFSSISDEEFLLLYEEITGS